MAKLKPIKIGLTLGLMLAVLSTLKTIFLLLFPNFIVKISNKIVYGMITINPPVITIDSFVIIIVTLFFGGFVWGIVFSLIYNKFVK